MKTSDYDYDLPPELVATAPAARRDASRLMVLRRDRDRPEHATFADLASLLRPGDHLVVNDTRVIPARLVGRREPGGGAVELLLLEPVEDIEAADGDGERGPGEGGPWTWRCYAKPARKLQPGVRIVFGPPAREGGAAGVAGPSSMAAGASCGPALAVGEVVAARDGGERIVRFVRAAHAPVTFGALLDRLGHPPLPPYILAARRHLEHDAALARPEDRSAYQTVFAREGRSVAAPTAGLHFTAELLARLEAAGVVVSRIRLDVGAGTFKPVEAEDPRAHPMHAEHYWIDGATAARLSAAKDAGARIVAVGTTVARALEAAALAAGGEGRTPGEASALAAEVAGAAPDGAPLVGGRAARLASPPAAPSAAPLSPIPLLHAGEGTTDLLILPGHRWRVVDALVTNFHLPRSTLLMLVAALRDRDTILAAYAEAVARGYRFYSYGDAMFVEGTSSSAGR